MAGYTEQDRELIAMLEQDNEQAIEVLFRRYYRFVCKSVYRIIKDPNTVEDIAQEVFYELWRKRDRIKINSSVSAYLKRSAINRSLNHIRSQRMIIDADEDHPSVQEQSIGAARQLEFEEVQDAVNHAIDQLPERCRLVFSLSRFEEMSYKEIAAHLGISVKTVENQISKALRILRVSLAKYTKPD